MEKLIELLNEYDKIKWDKEEPIYNWKIAIKTKIYQTYLVSARYGFIKRLIENDKINLEDLQCVFSWNINKWKTLMLETDGYERYEWTEYEATESLLMLLSISDSPIEDLISYLK